MFVDSHCHLDLIDLADHQNSFAYLMQTIADADVDAMLLISISLSRFKRLQEIAQTYPQVKLSVGVHPTQAITECCDYEKLRSLAEDERVIAIGETGLDFYHNEVTPKAQHERFECHIEVANHTQKPLVIHTREAAEATIKMLKMASCRGIMHCFTESWEVAKSALNLGFYISFSGIVSFKNAHQVHQVAKKVPADRFLIETDSPWLAPTPFRGQPNHPGLVPHVAEALATLRQTSLADIAQQSRENYYTLFKGFYD